MGVYCNIRIVNSDSGLTYATVSTPTFFIHNTATSVSDVAGGAIDVAQQAVLCEHCVFTENAVFAAVKGVHCLLIVFCEEVRNIILCIFPFF